MKPDHPIVRGTVELVLGKSKTAEMPRRVNLLGRAPIAEFRADLVATIPVMLPAIDPMKKSGKLTDMLRRVIAHATRSAIEELVSPALADLKASITELRTEMTGSVADARKESNDSVAGLRTEMKDSIAGLRTEMKDSMAELRGEMKDSIAGLRGELQHSVTGLRAEMKDSAAELRGEIRTSVAGLDTKLNDSVAELRGEIKESVIGLRIEMKQEHTELKAGQASLAARLDAVIANASAGFTSLNQRIDTLAVQQGRMVEEIAVLQPLRAAGDDLAHRVNRLEDRVFASR